MIHIKVDNRILCGERLNTWKATVTVWHAIEWKKKELCPTCVKIAKRDHGLIV